MVDSSAYRDTEEMVVEMAAGCTRCRLASLDFTLYALWIRTFSICDSFLFIYYLKRLCGGYPKRENEIIDILGGSDSGCGVVRYDIFDC